MRQARRGLEKTPRVVVLRAREHLLGQARLADATALQHEHVVGDRPDDGEVVRDEQERKAELRAQLLEQLQHRRLDGRVQRGRDLVAHEELGPAASARDRDALALAAGELAREPVGEPAREAHPLEQPCHLGRASAPEIPAAGAGRAISSRIRLLGLSESYGFWNTICSRRRCSRVRERARGASCLAVSRMAPADGVQPATQRAIVVFPSRLAHDRQTGAARKLERHVVDDRHGPCAACRPSTERIAPRPGAPRRPLDQLRNRRDESPRVLVPRARDHLRRVALLDDAALVHDRDAVGDRRDDGEVVADVHHCDPRSDRSRSTSSRIRACVTTSRPVVGSSMTTAAGSQTSAVAIVTRCCWPPESSCGYRRAKAASPGR